MSQITLILQPFCSIGTPRSNIYPCDIGTFNNYTGINQSSDCTNCSAGYYCATNGLTVPTGPCNAGYFCKTGAETASPTQGIYANVCPKGMLLTHALGKNGA